MYIGDVHDDHSDRNKDMEEHSENIEDSDMSMSIIKHSYMLSGSRKEDETRNPPKGVRLSPSLVSRTTAKVIISSPPYGENSNSSLAGRMTDAKLVIIWGYTS